MKIITVVFLLCLISGLASASQYFPSAPIHPKDKSECDRYYQHAMTAKDAVVTQAKKIGKEKYAELLAYIKGETGRAEYDHLERKSKKLWDEASRLGTQASRERNACYNRVRTHEKSVREQKETYLNSTVNNTVSGTYKYLTRAQIKNYVNKKSPAAALIGSAQMTYKKKAHHFRLANQAWALMNGKGTWQERLTGIDGISKELNRIRPGGLLSRTLTSGSLSILTQNSYNLMNQLNQSFTDFHQVNISHTKNNYVDLMRKGTFAYDVSRNNEQSMGEIISAIINRNNPTQHPSQYYSTIINEVQNTMQKQQRQQEQARMTKQQEIHRRKFQAGVVKQKKFNNRNKKKKLDLLVAVFLINSGVDYESIYYCNAGHFLWLCECTYFDICVYPLFRGILEPTKI